MLKVILKSQIESLESEINTRQKALDEKKKELEELEQEKTAAGEYLRKKELKHHNFYYIDPLGVYADRCKMAQYVIDAHEAGQKYGAEQERAKIFYHGDIK